jgi:hypothetical protein
MIKVFIHLLWIIEFHPVLYGHLLRLSKDVVVLSLESSLNVITNTSIVGSFLIIFVLHLAVAFIIISIAHIAVTSVIVIARVVPKPDCLLGPPTHPLRPIDLSARPTRKYLSIFEHIQIYLKYF